MNWRIGVVAGRRAGGLACLALATGAMPAMATETLCTGSEPFRITTVVERLRSSRGDLVVEIYPDDPARFLKSKQQVNSIHVKVERAPQSVCLPVPGPGGYGVAVFHDENGDRKFNRNFLGIPTEGFGLSNNPGIKLSSPSLESVRFIAGEGETTIHIRMRYVGGDGSPSK